MLRPHMLFDESSKLENGVYMLSRWRLDRSIFVALLCASFVLPACGGTQRDSALTTDQETLTKASLEGDFAKTMAEADAAWQQRITKDQLLNAIQLWEKAALLPTPELDAAGRSNAIADINEKLARAYYFLADSHIRVEASGDERDDEIMAVFEKGVTAAERAIALRDPAFAAKVAADKNAWQKAVGEADPAAIPGLYWYATNLGKWALLEGIATILARKDDIKATMDWIVAKDPNFFYGAPHRYFGTYHTKVPLGGGNPSASKTSFESAIAIAPDYLATKVLMAEAYAVLVGDRALFEKLLNEVLSAPSNATPEIEPENAFEKRKAKRLLDNADEFFY